ncbi:MAG: dihydropteroate synthase [Actinomycetota bacterium]|nr:dihydropteroate synthase [Actinomycetota bacterium]
MGIVNRTPDSFYDQGRTFRAAAAVAAAERALDAGAAIVDIGGVKAGRGTPVSAQEETDRVCEVVAQLRLRRPDAVISVDTWRASVARAAVAVGADLLNDPWEGHDPDLVHVAAQTGAGIVCAHAGHLPPRTEPVEPRYDDVVADVVRTVTGLAEQAVTAGVRRDGVLIDPAHDFGKTTAHSLEVTRRLGELVDTGWPVLVAMSNKDFIGETLDLPVHARLPGTLAVTALAAWQGARIFRAHNVAEVRQVLDMVASVRGDRAPAAPRRGLTRGGASMPSS